MASVFSLCFMLLMGASVFADPVTIAWDPSPDSAVTGYVVQVGTTSGVYTETFDVAGATSFVYNNAVAGRQYFFTVLAYQPGPVYGLPSVEVSGFSNAPPSLTSPGSQAGSVGMPATLQLVGSDLYGDALTYGATGLPPGLAMVGGTGYISGTPTTAGTYQVTATVSDGVLSAKVSFSWTITSPTATAPTLISPTGTIATVTPDFVWNAATDAASYVLRVSDSQKSPAIQLSLSASQAGCAGGGTCRVSPGVALAPGPAQWQVQTTTSAGATAWSGTMSFTVPQPSDTTSPSLSITTPTTALTYSATTNAVTLGGTAGDNVGVTQVTWTTDRGNSGSASGTTAWTAGVPLAGGVNVITVEARDAAGNRTSAMLTVTYVAPALLVSPSGLISTQTPTFTWNPAAGAVSYALRVDDSVQAKKIDLQVSAVDAGCAAGGHCAVAPGVSLAAGAARWSVQSRGADGTGPSSTVLTFTVPDTVAPAIRIVTPTSAATFATKTASLTIAGTADDAVGVTQVSWTTDRGASGTAAGTTSWAASVSLKEGTNVVAVTARDAAGNKTTAMLTITYTVPDTTPPSVVISTPSTSPAYVVTSGLTLAGAASDASGVSRVAWSSDRGASGLAQGTTTWAAAIPLAPGTNLLTVSVTDGAGNTATSTATAIYVTPATLVSPGGAIRTAVPAFTWNASPAATQYVLLVDDSTQLGKIMASFTPDQAGCATGGTCTVAPGITLAAGAARWSVKTLSGSEGVWSTAMSFTIDLTAPTIMIHTPTKGSSYSTSLSSVSLAGSAGDNSGAVMVTWSTGQGVSGAATGTTSWNTGPIPLQPGSNVITVTARDAAGNSASDVLTVTVKSSGHR